MPVSAASIIGAAALGGGALSYFGSQSAAKKAAEATRAYIAWEQGQRDLYHAQPETQAIKLRLAKYAQGELPTDMTNQIQEDYGKSLADMTRLIPKAGVQPGGASTPGRRERTARLLGENIASNKANTMRTAKQEMERFAVGALPMYQVGKPGASTIDPNTFATAAGGNMPSPYSFLGPALNTAGQYGALGYAARTGGPIERLLARYRNPIQDANADIYRYPSNVNTGVSFYDQAPWQSVPSNFI